MKKLIILFIALIVILPEAGAAPAQKNILKVLAKNGEVLIRNKKAPAWKTLQRGDSITNADEIKIQQGGYLNLMHPSGRNIELKNTGVYQVASLIQKIPVKQTPLYQRFFRFLFDEIFVTTSDNKNFFPGGAERSLNLDCLIKSKPKEKAGSIPGSPNEDHASLADAEYQRNLIFTVFPKNTVLLETNVDFVWHKKSTLNNYEFKLVDKNDNVIFTKKVFDTTITLDLNSLNLQKNNCYYWYVECGFVKSASFCIYLLTEPEIKSIKDTAEILIKDLKNDKGATPKLLLASYYAEKNCSKEAITYFKEAIKAAPGIKDYENIYNDYLVSIGSMENGKNLK